MIWGLTLEPGCVYTRSVTAETHLSLATLDCRGKVFAGTDPVKVSHVVLKTNDCELLLCSLVQGLVLQQQLDLKVMPNEEVAFSNQGNCCVYITGYSLEAEYNYKLDDSPSEGSILETPTSAYQVHSEWEADEAEAYKTRDEGDSEFTAELTAGTREEQERSDNRDGRELNGNQNLTANDKVVSASEETVACQDDEDVFCIAVKEEPEDSEDNQVEELCGDDGQELTTEAGKQSSGRNTFDTSLTSQMTAQQNESEPMQQTAVSETSSPALLEDRIDDNLEDYSESSQIVAYSHEDGQIVQGNQVEQSVERMPQYSREIQCVQQKSRLSVDPSKAVVKTTRSRVDRNLSVAMSSSKKPQRPPTVAEMISRAGHKKLRQVHHPIAERGGDMLDHHETRLNLLSCSPHDLRLQFPSYDATGRGSRFQCRFCSKTLNCRRSLIHHEMIHTGDKPFSCRFCQKSFIQKSQWKVHERIHTGVKPFVCKLCGKAFSRLYNKRMHAKTCKSFNTLNIVQCEKTPD